MKILIVVISVVVFVVCFPSIKAFCKRIILARKLKRACKTNHLSLYPTHLFWFFGGRRGAHCDFYIETEHEIYSVKLFGVIHRASVLVFTEARQYFLRNFVVYLAPFLIGYSFEGKRKDFKAYDFRKNFHDEWKTKPTRNILLIHPMCREIYYNPDHGNLKLLSGGDILFDCEIESLSRLILQLKKCN